MCCGGDGFASNYKCLVKKALTPKGNAIFLENIKNVESKFWFCKSEIDLTNFPKFSE